MMATGKPKHTYLVGYLHDRGHGRAILHLMAPINDEEALLGAERLLAEKNGFECSIFTYQLIEIRS